MKRIVDFMVAMLMISSLISSCGSNNVNEPEVPDVKDPEAFEDVVNRIELSEQQKMAQVALENFSFSFLNFVQKEGSTNTLTSSASLSGALSMLANGAKGETLDEMVRVLNGGKGSEGLQQLNDYWSVMLNNLPNLDSRINISFANSVWSRPEVVMDKNYISTLENHFYADVFENVDLSNNAGLAMANNWVADKTKGLISNLFESPVESDITLINTLYFKAPWAIQFDEKKTVSGIFNNVGGSKSKVDYLYMDDEDMGYAETDEAEIVKLPFGLRTVEMVIILPKSGITLKDIIKEMTSEKFNAWEKQCNNTWLKLKLPKFSVESGYDDIIDFLIKSGMTKLKEGGDFTGMFVKRGNQTHDGCVNKVIQKNRLSIDEKGCEAASATAVLACLWNGESAVRQPREITFDRPFMFIIRDSRSGMPLFMGDVKNL